MKLFDLFKLKIETRLIRSDYTFPLPSIRKTVQIATYYSARSAQSKKIQRISQLKFRLNPKTIVSNLLSYSITPWNEQDWKKRDGSF